MADEAEDAKVEFANRAAGWRASHLWLHHMAHGAQALDDHSIEEYERISETLVEGIRHPLRQLESACFWILEGSPLG